MSITSHFYLKLFPNPSSSAVTVIITLLAADDLRVTDAATGEPEGPDGGALDGARRLGAVLPAGGGGGQREQHLGRERFGEYSGLTMLTDYLIGVSLDTSRLLATVGHAGAGEVGGVAHVHRHLLVDGLRLDDDLPVSCNARIHQSWHSDLTTNKPFVSRANPGWRKYNSD